MIAQLGEWFKGLRDRYELRIFRDRMVLQNMRTGRSVDRRATKPFSSDRMLLADPDAAAALLRELIRELEQANRIVKWPDVTVYPMEPGTGGLSDPEARTIRELVEAAGFAKVTLVRG